jgi:hypothetical protein
VGALEHDVQIAAIPVLPTPGDSQHRLELGEDLALHSHLRE